MERKRVVGVLLFCALAAQQQGAAAGEAVAHRTNYAPITHMLYKYTYRPKYCKTFPQKPAEGLRPTVHRRVYREALRGRTGGANVAGRDEEYRAQTEVYS